jgi:hypothetical protein
MWLRISCASLIYLLMANPVFAGLFKKNQPKPDPSKYVPELIMILKTDKDESKRSKAAEELRDYDPKAFPDLMPSLIDALQNDPSASVRVEAINSLSKLRPISQQVGYALEQVLQNDSSIRVRVAARTTLWQYHLMGYRSGRMPDKGIDQTQEPPVATPMKSPPISTKSSTPIIEVPSTPPMPTTMKGLFPFLRGGSTKPTLPTQTSEPPIVTNPKQVEELPVVIIDRLAPMQMPIGEKKPVEAKPTSNLKKPEGKSESEGPVLIPPKF